jgi:hypothetical protein
MTTRVRDPAADDHPNGWRSGFWDDGEQSDACRTRQNCRYHKRGQGNHRVITRCGGFERTCIRSESRGVAC